MKLLLVAVLLIVCVSTYGQDNFYADYVEMERQETISKFRQSKKVRISFGWNDLSIRYFRKTGQILFITSWHEFANDNEITIFFFRNDSLLMISPIGQPPYYIRNNKLEYGEELKHTETEIAILISHGLKYQDLWKEKYLRRRKNR